MKTHRQVTAFVLALSLAALALAFARAPFAPVAKAQEQQYGALERGYRTGYSDGYQAGWGDQLKRAPSDFRSKDDFQRADRAYIAAYGSLEDYRDGYQQGYEVGYNAGYKRDGFDSNIPAGGVTRRGATPQTAASRESTEAGESASGGRHETGASDSIPRGTPPRAQGNAPAPVSNTGGPNPVPADTVLLVELRSRLSTDVSQRGDRFEAQVVEPKDMAGATVGGHLADVKRPGKASGRALLQLEFDQIRMPGESDFHDFSAQVVEVLPSGDNGTGSVDPEGGVRGQSSTKDDAVKVGAGAGVGAIIGAIAGGGKGAAIGAIIGGGAGTARVMTERGKDIHLEPGQQLRIRSTGRTR
jgi:hypothetical protein